MKGFGGEFIFPHENYGFLNLGFTFAFLAFLPFIDSAEILPPNPFYSKEINMLALTEKPSLCYTGACLETGAFMYENMDKNEDPCNNFYKYACGNFVKNAKIPDDKNKVDVLSLLQKKVYRKLRRILHGSDNRKLYRLVKTFYQSCMNTDETIKTGNVTLMMKSMGGWPVTEGDSWNEEAFDWQKAASIARKFGYRPNYFFDFGVLPGLSDATKHTLAIDQPRLSISREYLIKGDSNEYVRYHFNEMISIAETFGAKREDAERDMLQVLHFERSLANIMVSRTDHRNVKALNNPMTIAQLNKNFSSVSWLEYINAQLPSSLTVNEDEVVIVANPNYFSKLHVLLQKTPKRTIANYFIVKILLISSIYLEDLNSRQIISKADISLEKHPERWEECTTVTSRILPIAMSSVFVREHLAKETKKDVLDMISTLKQSFVNILKDIKWMDLKSKEYALIKLEAMSNQIAYPDELLDNKRLEEYYKGLELSEGSYLENLLKIKKFDIDNEYGSLKKPVNKKDWKYFANVVINVDAYYQPSYNTLYIPAAIIQDVSFDKNRTKYLNYGALGSIISHEMLHGYDDVGIQFGKDGNAYDWCSKSSKSNFQKRAQCVINQYSNFTVDEIGIKLNGLNTLAENIADIGSVKIAYDAYKQWVREHGAERKLPVLGKSPEQLFWLSIANVWCEKRERISLEHVAMTEEHTPGEFRVLGMVMNSPQFAKDFSCPPGSRMNPAKRCAVW